MSERILESILGELKGVNQRLDGMDQRFDGIDQRLDRMDQRFDGIDQRLDKIDHRFDRIETTLGEVKVAVLETHETAAIDSLKTEQQRHGKIIEALAVKSLEHDTDIRELKRAR